jgi:hypothetical protein
MSTDLYRVRVLDVDPAQRKVTFRVFLVYYDWEGVTQGSAKGKAK